MKCRRQIKTLIFLAAAIAGAGPSAAANVTIGKDKSDIALGPSWSGGVAPGSGDSVNFGVGGFYGPFTLSADVTYQRFASGGWGLFDPINGNAAQEFDLCGHTMTLTGNAVGDSYVFNPCNGGPRNHFVFSNGKIAILQNGSVTIGWSSSLYRSRVHLTGIELTGIANLSLGMSQSYDSELSIDGGSAVSANRMTLSREGVGSNTDKPNRLFAANARLDIADSFQTSSGGVVELAEGASFAVGTFQSGLLAGETSVLISNATLAVARAYETAKGAGSTDRTEVVGASALLKAKEICVGNNPDASAVILARDGATVEGSDAVWVGNEGPAALTFSNANLKARALVIGKSAGSAGSVLRFTGESCSLEIGYDSLENELFGAGGASRFEVCRGARINPWTWNESWQFAAYPRNIVGGASSSNVFSVVGAGTLYDSYHAELTVGCRSTAGNRFEVADGATCNLRRLFISGTNTFMVAGGTVNVSHGDSYHTSIVIGASGDGGGQLVFSGAAPKIDFTDYDGRGAFHGGVKACPGTKIVYNLPAMPYEIVPLDTYWLHMQHDENHPEMPLAEISLGLSDIPKTHGRLAYRLLHVQDVSCISATHSDVIARVNDLPEVKAIRGCLAWRGTDLVFTVPSSLGMVIIAR